MRRLPIVFISILLLISCNGNSAALRCFDKALLNTATNLGVPSVTATIIKDSDTIWYGKYGEKTEQDSLFCIGSISKSFVAVLALLLEQEKVISLDDTIGKYLPDIDFWNKDSITLQELLSMRSGIADYIADFDAEDYFIDYEQKSLIEKGLSNSSFLKQGDFQYSNTNILLMAQIIEKVTGKSCEELIEKRILVPLGLKSTFFAEDKENIKGRLVSGYSNTKTKTNVDFTNTTTSWASLACGMYSTAADMSKWGDALLHSSLLSDESRKKALSFLPVKDGLDYGLCIIQKQIDKKHFIALQGNVPGYSTVIYIWGDNVLTVLCNLSDYSGNNVSYSEKIAEYILGRLE